MRQGDEPDEVLMPMPTDHALRQSEITALRMLGDTVQSCARAIQDMRADLREQRDALIELKPLLASIADLKADVAVLKAKIDSLEADRDRRTGAMNLIQWISKNAPWLIAILAAAGAVAIKRKTEG